MDYQEIERLLNADVWLVRKASSEEKEVFADKKEGGFFTFVLKSGPRFISCFSEEGTGLKRKKRLTFRPLNKVVKGLEEFSWIIPTYVLGEIFYGDTQEEFKFSKGISKEKRDAIVDVLEHGRPGAMDDKSSNPPLLDSALKVSKAYFKAVQAAQNLKKMLIPSTNRVILNKSKQGR